MIPTNLLMPILMLEEDWCNTPTSLIVDLNMLVALPTIVMLKDFVTLTKFKAKLLAHTCNKIICKWSFTKVSGILGVS